MSEARSFAKLAELGQVIALACTPDGSIVGVNDIEGRVWFYALDSDGPGQELEALPLHFTAADTSGVLLHPDGRVISFRCDSELRISIHDPRRGSLVRELVFGPIAEHEHEDEHEHEPDYEQPSVEEGYYFNVAILQRPPPLDWLQPLDIANYGSESPIAWWSTLPDRLRYLDMYPDRWTRMALHPNGRWLAVLDRGTWVVDLDTGELVCAFEYAIDEAGMLEYGETTHTVGFDEAGLLTVASVAISGNPFLYVDRLRVESGELESSTENWRQIWTSFEAPNIEVHLYDPTTHLPPARISAGVYKVLFRRWGFELWSGSGLERGFVVPPSICVIPSFNPGSVCSHPRALLVGHDSLELLDIVSGERSLLRPPLDEAAPIAALDHIGFDPAGERVLLWRDRVALLGAAIDQDRWGVCKLPEGRRMREWAFASERGLVFVIDEDGELWIGRVDPEPGSSPRPRASLHQLARELLARPDDPTPFLVYADALIERGDTHGELIMLQHQGAFEEAEALIEREREALLGPLAKLDPANVELSWERGYVRKAKFSITYDQLGTLLAFLASERGRLLESLELQLVSRSEEDDVSETYQRIDAYLAAGRHLPWLRSLKLGRPGEHALSAELLAALPRLDSF